MCITDNFRVSRYRVYVLLCIYYANIKLNASGYNNISVSTTHVQKCQDTFIQYYGIPSNIVYSTRVPSTSEPDPKILTLPLSEYPGIPYYPLHPRIEAPIPPCLNIPGFPSTHIHPRKIPGLRHLYPPPPPPPCLNILGFPSTQVYTFKKVPRIETPVPPPPIFHFLSIPGFPSTQVHPRDRATCLCSTYLK